MVNLCRLTAFEIIKDSHLYFKPLYNSQPEYYICHHHKCGRKFASEVNILRPPFYPMRRLIKHFKNGLRTHFEWHISKVTPSLADLPSNRNKKKTLNSCNFLFYMKRDEPLFPKEVFSS